jgi:membrane-bound serine protease (ClpP class)
VRQSFSLTENEAVKQRVVDLEVPDLPGLLDTVNGRAVMTAAGERAVHTAGAEVRRFDMTFIDRFLAVLVNPDLAYILMVVGIFGIIFELSAPGIGAPGIAGAIAILLSLVGFGSLPTNLGGFVFIALAVVLFIVDIKVPSHGVWTAGGIASFVLGSFLLFPPWRPPTLPSAPEIRVSPVTIVVMTACIALFFILVISKGIAAQTRRITFGAEVLIGITGEAVTDLIPEGQVRALGEVWSARSSEGEIKKGEEIEVVAREGLRLVVKRKPASP